MGFTVILITVFCATLLATSFRITMKYSSFIMRYALASLKRRVPFLG